MFVKGRVRYKMGHVEGDSASAKLVWKPSLGKCLGASERVSQDLAKRAADPSIAA